MSYPVFSYLVLWRDSMMRTGMKSSPMLCRKSSSFCELDMFSKLRIWLFHILHDIYLLPESD